MTVLWIVHTNVKLFYVPLPRHAGCGWVTKWSERGQSTSPGQQLVSHYFGSSSCLHQRYLVLTDLNMNYKHKFSFVIKLSFPCYYIKFCERWFCMVSEESVFRESCWGLLSSFYSVFFMIYESSSVFRTLGWSTPCILFRKQLIFFTTVDCCIWQIYNRLKSWLITYLSCFFILMRIILVFVIEEKHFL